MVPFNNRIFVGFTENNSRRILTHDGEIADSDVGPQELGFDK